MRGLCLAIAWFLAPLSFAPLSFATLLFAPLFFAPLSAEGQTKIRLGGGPGVPIGSLSEGTKAVGPSFLAGVAIPVDHGYYLLIEGHHSRFGIDSEPFPNTGDGVEPDAATKLTGGNAGLLIEGIADPVGFYGHGGVGWARSTGKAGRSIDGTDANTGTADHSFMFVIGVGVNLSVSDRVGLTLNVRYNHVRDVFGERAQWIPVTASVVIRL